MTKETINQQLAGAPIRPLLIRLTIPATVAQLVNALYSIVDRMYIGHLEGIGTLALSGVGLTFPITMMIAALSYLPGMGGAPLASIALGEKNTEKARKYLGNAVFLLFVMSILSMAVCLFYLKPLLILFGADAETLPYAYDYLRTYLLGTLFVEFSLGLNPFINAQGFTTIGTLSVVIGAVLNLILDPLFLYVMDMGIQGAALATVLSQLVSCIWIVLFLRSKRSLIPLRLRDLRPDWRLIGKTCALGLSPFTFRVNESLVMILLNRLLRTYGGADANLHLASMTILNSVSQIFFMPLMGITSGAQPILSFNYGAGNFARIRETIHHARVLSISCAAVMWALILLLPGVITRLFNDDPQLIRLTTVTLRLMFCTVVCLGMQMINQNAFVAMGNTGYSFLFGIMRKLLILVPLALLLPRFFGVWGVYAAEMISNPVTTVITYVVFQRYMQGLQRKFDGPF